MLPLARLLRYDSLLHKAISILITPNVIPILQRKERNLGMGGTAPTPDASPLRLAQHDIFGAMTGRLNRLI